MIEDKRISGELVQIDYKEDGKPYRVKSVWQMQDGVKVEFAPVVRCKDCVYRRLTGKAPFMFYTCTIAEGLNVCKEEAFCSYGERKDDADN